MKTLRKNAPKRVVSDARIRTNKMVKRIRSLGQRQAGSFFFIEVGGVKFKADKAVLSKVAAATEGKLIELRPPGDILTTQDAADLLNVSRPFVTKLIDAGDIPCFMVGNQRRVRKSDLLNYKAKMRKSQDHAMDEMAAEAQELGLDF